METLTINISLNGSNSTVKFNLAHVDIDKLVSLVK